MKKKVVVGDFIESNSWGLMEVVDIKPKKITVRFVQTNYEVEASRGNVLAGKVRDKVAELKSSETWRPYIREYQNNSGEFFKSFQKRGNKVKVYFKGTGTVLEVFESNALAGKVKDPYNPSVYGKGFIGEFCKKEYRDYHRQAKQLWENMMKRCYSLKDPKGYYGRASVDSRWLNFSLFLNDLPQLEGFNHWLSFLKTGKGERYNLDKDTKEYNPEGIYSKHFCRFVTESFNKSEGAKNK